MASVADTDKPSLTQRDSLSLSGVFISMQSASEAIFRARTYNSITYSVRWWWLRGGGLLNLWMKLGGNRPPEDNPLLFLISGTGSFICPVAQTRLDIPRPLITQWWVGGAKCSVPWMGLEPTTRRGRTYQLSQPGSPSKEYIDMYRPGYMSKFQPVLDITSISPHFTVWYNWSLLHASCAPEECNR